MKHARLCKGLNQDSDALQGRHLEGIVFALHTKEGPIKKPALAVAAPESVSDANNNAGSNNSTAAPTTESHHKSPKAET